MGGQDVGGAARLNVLGDLSLNGGIVTAFVQGAGNVHFLGDTEVAASQYSLANGITTVDAGVALTLSNPGLNGFTDVLNLNGATTGPGSLSAGTFNLGPGSAINGNLQINIPTVFTNPVNGSGPIVNNSTLTFQDNVSVTAVNNTGRTTTFNGGTIAGSVTNFGTASFVGTTFNGTLTNNGGAATFDNATVNGTLNNTATVNFTGNNTANTAFSGSNVVQSGTLAFPSTYNQGAGSLSIAAGATATAPTFAIAGGSFGGNGTATGNFNVANATVSVSTINGNAVLGAGATLTRSSTINGSVTNDAGEVIPGQSPGTLVVNGNYTQGPNGTLTMELGGTNQGISYDLLRITGNASLDGTLNVKLFPPFPGSIGGFDLLTYASISDKSSSPGIPSTFSNIIMPPGFVFSSTSSFPFDPLASLLSFRLNVTGVPFISAGVPDAINAVLSNVNSTSGQILTAFGKGSSSEGTESDFSLAEEEEEDEQSGATEEGGGQTGLAADEAVGICN